MYTKKTAQSRAQSVTLHADIAMIHVLLMSGAVKTDDATGKGSPRKEELSSGESRKDIACDSVPYICGTKNEGQDENLSHTHHHSRTPLCNNLTDDGLQNTLLHPFAHLSRFDCAGLAQL
jgi:hypothetical protein